MKEIFSLRTIRKKIVMLTKLAGIALIFSYFMFLRLPVQEEVSFCLWMVFVGLLILLLDFFLGRFITKPVAELNTAAKRMAELDFSAHCSLSSSDELGELSDSLNTMAQNLEQALVRLGEANRQLQQDVERERYLLEERRELSDSLSHEMKTPLGIILAYAESLEEETEEGKRQKYARVIISEVQRMNELIVTLLDLSALESGASKLTVNTFDLVELTETVAGRLLVDMPDPDFELQYELPDQPAFVEADQKRMEQALTNLILNARKNVCPGGSLRIALGREEGLLHFSVFNQGRRIPQEELPKIWNKFYRDKGAAYSGSGLGLSITAQILSMHHLPYGAENLEDGVRFYFMIPCADTPCAGQQECQAVFT